MSASDRMADQIVDLETDVENLSDVLVALVRDTCPELIDPSILEGELLRQGRYSEWPMNNRQICAFLARQYGAEGLIERLKAHGN